MNYVAIGLILCVCLVPGTSIAQDSNSQEGAALLDEIKQADAELFEAFNSCDLETMGKVFAKDLEFYHDISGVTGYEQTMGATKANCDRDLGLKRELVSDSLQVYPVPGYGAMQIGKHTFCHLENGRNDCGTFDFVHVWRRTEDGWKVARVVSYGH